MEQVKERNVKVVVNCLSAKSIQSCKVNVRRGQHQILVKEVEHQFSIPHVIQTTMVHQQSPKELEFTQGEITGLNRTHTLITEKTNSNVCLLNHGNIIGTISD